MNLEHIRLSSNARNQLITLKRRSGLTQWNELCRWALCRSLAEASPPSEVEPESDGKGIEMTWKVFTGPYPEIYAALLEERCRADALSTDEETLSRQLRSHLHRGIGYLFGDKSVNDIAGLTALALENNDGQRQAAG
jgi:DNA sulfur modification protein DndE